MTWDKDLLDEQKRAARHVGSHARLLAGPGTGKTLTLTRRVCYLVKERGVAPGSILALTFTRAAAFELRHRIGKELGDDAELPRVATLHSFALRQLMRNASRAKRLPQPLRIADDWEERHVILEDLKALLSLPKIRDAQELINKLSADWHDLTADTREYDQRFPDPKFLGAWREHRTAYGYALRAELVYQLKRALEEDPGFVLEGPPKHLLVDEYQDLNRCDLAIAQVIASRGAEVFCAGDDDQSIYSFRKAYPDGIRGFTDEYDPSKPLDLQVCLRCDRKILDLALFVARQDPKRLEKKLHCPDGKPDGEVALLWFDDQDAEAAGVADLCRFLIDKRGLKPHDILLLLRSDRNGAYSSVLRAALEKRDLESSIGTEASDPLDTDLGRAAVSFLRLCSNSQDSLAWRTLLQVRKNGVGDLAIKAVYHLAVADGITFSAALRKVVADPSVVKRHGQKLKEEVEKIEADLASLGNSGETGEEEDDTPLDVEEIRARLESVLTGAGTEDECDAVLDRLEEIATGSGAETVGDLTRSLEVSDEGLEQEVVDGKINLLTMHRAKGLTAKATIVVAAEDETIPGRATGEQQLGDERRLLYVSLTRAKHHMFMTYCKRRTGAQQHTGRDSGTPARTLTQFLRGGPVKPGDGAKYVKSLK